MHSDSDDSFQINEICDEFEHEWREGRAPDIGVWSNLGDSAIRPALLRCLIAIQHIHKSRLNLAEVTPPDMREISNVSLVSRNIPDAAMGELERFSGQAPRTTLPTELLADAGESLESDAQAWRIPATIGGCRILEEIGRGGMGIVYKAWQTGVNRKVAIKLLYPSSSGGTSIKQFQAEAEATGRLQHPGIVQVHCTGQEHNSRYLIMEFVDGPNLEQFIGEQLLSGHETARIALGISRALAAMHANGVIHRDIKPANILIAKGGHPKIADFGLARLEDGGLSMTATGTVVGTPSYMSPEQARGDVRSIASAADIYALGGIIYRCLTGRPPFNAPRRLEVIDQILHQDPIPLHQLNLNTEPDLETICLRCLQKDPADRPATAEFLAGELQRFLDNEPIQSRPISGYRRMVRWCRRHPRIAMMRLALAALLLMVSAGIPLLLWQASLIALAEHQRELGERTISESQLREVLHLERANQAEKLAREQAHVADVQKYYATAMEASEVRAAKEPGWTWKTIRLVQNAASANLPEIDAVRLRSLAADAMTSIDTLKVQTFCEGLRIDEMGISRDGSTLALPEVRGDLTCDVHLRSVNPMHPSESQTPFKVSPSRRLSLNTLGNKFLSLLERTGTKRTPFPGFRCAAFSKDGRYCATGSRDGTLILWDLTLVTPMPVYKQKFKEQELQQILFSQDDQYLYLRHEDGRCLRILNRETGAELAKRESDIRGLVLLPEGRLLLAEVNSLVIADADSLEVIDEPIQQSVLDVCRSGEATVFTAQSGESIDVYDARTLLSGTTMQRAAYAGTWVYAHRTTTEAATIVGAIDPGIARIWDGLSGRHVSDLLLAGAVQPRVCIDERANRLFLMAGSTGTAYQIRAPGSAVDGLPATVPADAIMDFIASGARTVNSFELNSTGTELAVFENGLASGDLAHKSQRWQVQRMNRETRETLATWSFCKLHLTESAVWGAKPLGLTWAGHNDALYLATSMPNGLFRLSGDGFDVLGETLSPALRVAPAAVEKNLAEYHLPEAARNDCEHVRITVQCFAPRDLDVEHERLTFELQTHAGTIAASATGRQLSERGWYLLEVAIVGLEQLSGPAKLLCRLQSDELTLSQANSQRNTVLLMGDVLLFPQTANHIHNYTIGPLAGLADGTLAAINPEDFVQFWNESSEQPLDRWSDLANESPGLRAIASSTERVIVGTRFGNVFSLQPGQPARRIFGNVFDEGMENGHAISSVELSQDGQRAWIGRQDGSVIGLDLTEDPPRDLLSGIDMGSAITAIATSHDRTKLVVGARDGRIKLWNIDGHRLKAWFELSSLQSPVRKMRFSPDGRDLFVLCDYERAVRILHLGALNSEFEQLGIPPATDYVR